MSTGLSGFPVRLANCSGLANSGVPTKAPSVEIGALERDSSITFASPRSMIFAVILPSARLTMMLVGLMSRCTRFWFWMAVNPAATCATISSAKSVSNFPQRLISFSSVSPPSRGSSSNRFCPSVTPRQHLGNVRWRPPFSRLQPSFLQRISASESHEFSPVLLAKW